MLSIEPPLGWGFKTWGGSEGLPLFYADFRAHESPARGGAVHMRYTLRVFKTDGETAPKTLAIRRKGISMQFACDGGNQQ